MNKQATEIETYYCPYCCVQDGERHKQECNISKVLEFVYKPKPGPKEKIEFNRKNCPDL